MSTTGRCICLAVEVKYELSFSRICGGLNATVSFTYSQIHRLLQIHFGITKTGQALFVLTLFKECYPMFHHNGEPRSKAR